MARLQAVREFNSETKAFEVHWLTQSEDGVLCELLHVPGRGWRWWVDVYHHAPVGIWWATVFGAGADFLRSMESRTKR